MAAQTPALKFPLTVSVIAEDPCAVLHEVTAFPGGYVFVPAALFRAAQDEAEFAGMLAQAAARSTQVTASQIGLRPDIPLIFFGKGCLEGQMIPLAQRPDGPRADALDPTFQSDAIALYLMARLGFDPAALARYVERVQPKAFSVYTGLPDHDERIARMRSVIERLARAEYDADDPEFARIQSEMRRLSEAQKPIAAHPTLNRK